MSTILLKILRELLYNIPNFKNFQFVLNNPPLDFPIFIFAYTKQHIEELLHQLSFAWFQSKNSEIKGRDTTYIILYSHTNNVSINNNIRSILSMWPFIFKQVWKNAIKLNEFIRQNLIIKLLYKSYMA
jgi:hypothetical protein